MRSSGPKQPRDHHSDAGGSQDGAAGASSGAGDAAGTDPLAHRNDHVHRDDQARRAGPAHRDHRPGESHGLGGGTSAGRPEVPEYAAPNAAPFPRRALDPAHVMAARLLLMVPLVIGVLLAEGIFAARGEDADGISLPAALVAFLLLWQGIAWALRSWVAVLLTFVPAVMITLGTAMVGHVERVGGAVLLAVGVTIMLAIVFSRVTAPQRRWTPGWMAPGEDRAGIAGTGSDRGSGGVDRAPNAGDRAPNADGGAAHADGDDSGSDTDVTALWSSDRPGVENDDLLGALGETRQPSGWDTSATDRTARDDLVAELCRRGAAAGPTLATLEDFFAGNGDPRSIAPGLAGAVPLNDFRVTLHALRSRADVTDVLIQVEPLDAGAYPAGEWPVAGSVHVVGTIAPDDLESATARLRPEPVIGPLPVDELTDGRPAPAGVVEYAVWWE